MLSPSRLGSKNVQDRPRRENPIKNGVYLSEEIKISDHCLVDHLVRNTNPDAPR
jgi:hypothetical protein